MMPGLAHALNTADRCTGRRAVGHPRDRRTPVTARVIHHNADLLLRPAPEPYVATHRGRHPIGRILGGSEYQQAEIATTRAIIRARSEQTH